MKDGDRLVVYNPCIGQTRWIGLRTVYKALDKFALGYEKNKSCCGSYKIIRFPDFCDNPVSGEFDSDSWRVLDEVTHDWHLADEGRGVSYKGNTYWVASDEEELVDDFLLEFDFTKERFRRLPLPFKGDCQYDTVELSTVREEQLAVLFQNEDEETMEIWLTNKIDEPNDVPWRKFFAVDNGELNFFAMSFIVDEENKVAVCCDTYREDGDNRVNVFIVGEDVYREVELLQESADEPITYDNEPFLFGYVPSLVHIL